MNTIKLENGVQIPSIGFGTWAIFDESEVASTLKEAVKCGFRHIDTASFYKNEEAVGKAIAQCGIDRSQLWVTSKAWPSECGYDNTLRAFDASLERLGLDYLDLYLIHWPANDKTYPGIWKQRNLDTWRAFERLYAEGRVRAIGVSNFLENHLQPLLDGCNVKPMVDQLEIHPGYSQQSAVDFCQKNGIAVEAWSPFGRGKAFSNGTLKMLADKYCKTIAQICIRWCMQKGIIPLPKSVTPERILQNTQVFDFEISDDDMSEIDNLPNTGWSGEHPDEVNY